MVAKAPVKLAPAERHFAYPESATFGQAVDAAREALDAMFRADRRADAARSAGTPVPRTPSGRDCRRPVAAPRLSAPAGDRGDAMPAGQGLGDDEPSGAPGGADDRNGGHQRAGRLAGWNLKEMASMSGLRWVFCTAAIRHRPSMRTMV